jgi:hypothetical protein
VARGTAAAGASDMAVSLEFFFDHVHVGIRLAI